MTKEEFLRYGLETGFLKFSEYLQLTKPLNLPSNLNEACQKISEECYDGYLSCYEESHRIAARMGAEWMAGQYKTLGETEIYLEDDGGEAPYTQEWLDLATNEFAIPEGFNPGDKVEILIRKK